MIRRPFRDLQDELADKHAEEVSKTAGSAGLLNTHWENLMAGLKSKLKCTHEDWHHLATAVGNARDGSESIRVQKEALDRLMQDHSLFIDLKKGELTGDF